VTTAMAEQAARDRAAKRAGECSIRIHRKHPMARGNEVSVDGAFVGYISGEGQGRWSVVYTANGGREFVATVYQRPLAARALAVRHMRAEEQRLLAELELAGAVAADLWADGNVAWLFAGAARAVTSGLSLAEVESGTVELVETLIGKVA